MSPPFSAPWWARGPHRQTLFARLLRPDGGPRPTRERIDTADGDFLDLDWWPEPAQDAPVVLVLHGLEGSTRRKYVRNIAAELGRLGVRAVGMNFRGCSGEPNRTLRFYHSGETTDPTSVLELIRRRWPGRRVGAMGFSLGGNILLKLLGERADGGAGLVDAAAAMSVPYDLASGCRHLERDFMGGMYARYFLRSLGGKVEAKRALLQDRIDVNAALRARTIWAFDDLVTAPLHGFADAADYYARCSSNGFLGGIDVPTLLVHSRDDPFLPADSIPVAGASDNPRVELDLTERGGHVGFVAGRLGEPRFWADLRIAGFLAERLTA